MAQKDPIEKTLESYNDVFADIINTLLFEGRQVIAEQALTDATPFSYYKMEGGTMRGQERDAAKYWRKGRLRLSLFGLENQSAPDANMPLRIMNYDAAAYRAQLPLDVPQKTCYPVVTLVLYFGTERHWNTARSLRERISIPAELAPFVSDYRITVIELAWLTMRQIALFRSDFREVALYLRARRLGELYTGTERTLAHVQEILDLFTLMSGNDIYEKISRQITAQGRANKGGISMCEVTQRLLNEGREKGENAILSLFSKLYALGRDEDAKRAATDREYLKRLLEEYQK